MRPAAADPTCTCIGLRSPQHAVSAEHLDKSRTDADAINATKQAGGSQGRSAPNDHRLPRHQQHDSKPKQTMRDRCEPGGHRSAGGEGQATGQRGSDEDDE